MRSETLQSKNLQRINNIFSKDRIRISFFLLLGAEQSLLNISLLALVRFDEYNEE